MPLSYFPLLQRVGVNPESGWHNAELFGGQSWKFTPGRGFAEETLHVQGICKLSL